MPGLLWAGCIPFNLHPNLRASYPRLHRVLGRTFFAASAMLMAGYILILRNGLEDQHAEVAPHLAQECPPLRYLTALVPCHPRGRRVETIWTNAVSLHAPARNVLEHHGEQGDQGHSAVVLCDRHHRTGGCTPPRFFSPQGVGDPSHRKRDMGVNHAGHDPAFTPCSNPLSPHFDGDKFVEQLCIRHSAKGALHGANALGRESRDFWTPYIKGRRP